MLYYRAPEGGRSRLLPIEHSDLEEPTDAALVAAVAGGSMSALGTLVERHQQRVRALAFRLTARWDLADDLTQEAFLRLHRSAPHYRPTASLWTWLYRVVVNLVLDETKSRRWRRSHSSETDPPTACCTEDPLIRDEKIAAIRREIAALPERQRVALVLHRFDQLSHEQIAEVTGWSLSAVESLLVRAYSQLRQRLSEWVET